MSLINTLILLAYTYMYFFQQMIVSINFWPYHIHTEVG